MLFKLLELLRDNRTYSPGDLAQALDTTVEMIEAMLETLAQMGYVRQVDTCGESCASCASSCHCLQIGTGRIWALAK